MPFLCAGDQNPRSQAASNCDAWNSGTEEPADRKGEKDPAPGGISVLPWRLKKNSGHCGSLNLTNAWWSVPAAQHDYEKSRARHDQEEKLIISAWYNMVSECRHVLEGASVLYWGFHVSLTTENHLVHRVLLRPNKDPYWTRQKFLFCILYILFYAHIWSITPSLSVCLSLRGWRCIRRFLASGSVPPTRPCPSWPSRGSPPTPREAWHGTTRDKTSSRSNKHERKHRDDEAIYSRLLHPNSLHLFCLYAFFTGSLHLRVFLMLLLPPAGS